MFWFLFGQNHDSSSRCQKDRYICQIDLIVVLSLSDFSRDAILLVITRRHKIRGILLISFRNIDDIH